MKNMSMATYGGPIKKYTPSVDGVSSFVLCAVVPGPTQKSLSDLGKTFALVQYTCVP
jgi:hypothetical protein